MNVEELPDETALREEMRIELFGDLPAEVRGRPFPSREGTRRGPARAARGG